MEHEAGSTTGQKDDDRVEMVAGQDGDPRVGLAGLPQQPSCATVDALIQGQVAVTLPRGEVPARQRPGSVPGMKRDGIEVTIGEFRHDPSTMRPDLIPADRTAADTTGMAIM